MKAKILYFIVLITFALFVTSCELDNIPGPDAQLQGSIIDDKTGELVTQDVMQGSTIDFYEHGYNNPTKQALFIRNNGTFTNNLMFSGSYTVTTPTANWYPTDSLKNFILTPGANKYDFRVTPYLRIKNLAIVNNSGVIEARFMLEGGQLSTTLKTMTLCAHSDHNVAIGLRFTIQGTPNNSTKSFANVAVPVTEQNLSINLSQNTALFVAGRTYYFRVAALTGVSGAKENYSPAIKITL